ncbi:MAG: sigma-70 family RNA polymerase sigma factor [Gammaproteobacteria bacterium]|nr:sigma-70 family RNA polymerase sigma factor [Gammaproteobacteria bacterium]
MHETGGNITAILERAAAGDPAAHEDLFSHIYPALRKIARSQLNSHRRGTICTTELVNEASLKLFGSEKLGGLENGGHLMATAARAMRHILVDRARKRNSKKRGGDWYRIDLQENQLSADGLSDQVLALDEALQRLHRADKRCHQVVELKFFGGCTIDEIAELLDISEGTVKLAWRKSRAFLYADMERDV